MQTVNSYLPGRDRECECSLFTLLLFRLPRIRADSTPAAVVYVYSPNCLVDNCIACWWCLDVGADADKYLSWFDVNKTSGQLQLTLDDHQLSTSLTGQSVQLVVKATTDCSSGYWEMTAHRLRHVTSATLDDSLLLVSVTLVVMAMPRFTATSVYAAVMPQAQTGHEVIRLEVSSPS